jgi:hypothetical protein
MEETFRPRSNFAWAVVSYLLLGLFALNSIFVGSDAGQSMIELGVCAIFTVVAHLIWVRPKLVVTDTAVRVVNPITSITIPFGEIKDMETKWALTIVHAQGRTTAWVAPAGGKRRWIADQTFRWYGSGVPLTESRGVETDSMSASLDSYSGQAAYLIRERMKRSH